MKLGENCIQAGINSNFKMGLSEAVLWKKILLLFS